MKEKPDRIKLWEQMYDLRFDNYILNLATV